jgi:hypothetical protein
MSRFRPTLILAVALLASAGVAPTFAQDTSRVSMITGKVIDEKTGQALSEVTVQIVGQEVVGTRRATLTGMDGRYRLVNVRPGTVTITVRRIGYTLKSITGILVEPGKTIEQDIILAPGSIELSAIVVSADRERATIAEAFENQRLAPGILTTINRESIQKSPDGDAAQVAKRGAGITLTHEKTVNVRGLDPRYTQVALNDSRLPSPDPEKKVVPLDMFPSGLLDGITVSKTFTPDQPGDFSGAMVHIKTREFPADRTASYSLGMGFNTATAGRALPAPLGVGGESFAFVGGGRQLPTAIRNSGNLSNTTWSERNAMINSFRKTWRPGESGGEPNGSMSATFGGSELVGGQRIGYIASGTYSLSREVHLNESVSGAQPNGGQLVPINTFTGTSAGTSALWGGILNLSTLLGTHSQLRLNNTYTRTADNEARVRRGLSEDLGLPLLIEQMDYVQRTVWSSQVVAERETDANKMKFSLTGSAVKRVQPDASEFAREISTDGTGAERLLWMNTYTQGATRTFADLREKSAESAVDFQRRLGGLGSGRFVKVGALGRYVDRDADTRLYDIFAASLTDDERALPPEVLFGGQFTQPNSTVMQLITLSQGGNYGAKDYLAAGYAMFDGPVRENLRLTSGVRFEESILKLRAVSSLGAPAPIRKAYGDLLPSLALTYSPSARNNFRASVTRTLARPEYREVAPLSYLDFDTRKVVRGNPDLVRTLIDNADMRWEFYPERGEVLSVGVFAKRFQDPIETVALASSGGGLETMVNAKGATGVGVELEARRNLRLLADALEPLTAFTNLTVMRSRIDIDTTFASSTNPNRAMVGQAPYIVNAGLTYASLANPERSATLLFNRIGERISAAGEAPLPDVIEAARSTLDLSLRFPLLRGMSGRLDAKNLLDTPMEERQGPVIRERYTTGRVFQAAITWR